MDIFFPGPLFGACEEKLHLGVYRFLWPRLFLLIIRQKLFQSMVRMIPSLRKTKYHCREMQEELQQYFYFAKFLSLTLIKLPPLLLVLSSSGVWVRGSQKSLAVFTEAKGITQSVEGSRRRAQGALKKPSNH